MPAHLVQLPRARRRLLFCSLAYKHNAVQSHTHTSPPSKEIIISLEYVGRDLSSVMWLSCDHNMKLATNKYELSYIPQSYNAIFEAAIEGVTQNQARGKSLTFEVAGEGNLPRVTVARPTVRNKRGQPLLLFKRILLGTSQCLPLELVNDGTLPCKVRMCWVSLPLCCHFVCLLYGCLLFCLCQHSSLPQGIVLKCLPYPWNCENWFNLTFPVFLSPHVYFVFTCYLFPFISEDVCV